MSDLTVADELEFESWPKEKQELAKQYVLENFADSDFYDAGWSKGFDVGYKAGLRQSNGNDS